MTRKSRKRDLKSSRNGGRPLYSSLVNRSTACLRCCPYRFFNSTLSHTLAHSASGHTKKPKGPCCGPQRDSKREMRDETEAGRDATTDRRAIRRQLRARQTAGSKVGASSVRRRRLSTQAHTRLARLINTADRHASTRTTTMIHGQSTVLPHGCSVCLKTMNDVFH